MINATYIYFSLLKDNISVNKIATQSHTYGGKINGASNAVDGNTSTCMKADTIGRTSIEKTVWWKVDLGRLYNIYRINIMFKNYVQYGM